MGYYKVGFPRQLQDRDWSSEKSNLCLEGENFQLLPPPTPSLTQWREGGLDIGLYKFLDNEIQRACGLENMLGGWCALVVSWADVWVA